MKTHLKTFFQAADRTPALTALFILLGTASGCANYAQNPRLFIADESSLSGIYSAGTQGAEPCRATPNVLPRQDVSLDGRDRYIACGSAEKADQFHLWGESSSETTELCVFPALRNSAGQVGILKEEDGDPKMLCGDVDPTEGASFTFNDTTYNAVFVVPAGARIQMAACLRANNPSSCPNYSFGKFR
jgi:hypothetical protein